MSIAIKEITKEDKEKFDIFRKTDRSTLPKLMLSHLAPPHQDVAVIYSKNIDSFISKIDELCTLYDYNQYRWSNNILSISQSTPIKLGLSDYLFFSGYIFNDEKMLIGPFEVQDNYCEYEDIHSKYGEYCSCKIESDTIELRSDFFGMVPWFYYCKDDVFCCSNNYHLLLILLSKMNLKLLMDIKRSRVNVITSGFLYGSPFSKSMDVCDTYVNLSFEEITWKKEKILVNRTELWNIISSNEKWDENVYESYLNKAKDELYSCCKAAFESNHFDKIIVDVSGGFDSRIVFATVCNLPKKLRSKVYTYTRKSGTNDDVEKANALTNLYNYPKYVYAPFDDSDVVVKDGVNLAHVSRTLGSFTASSHLYCSKYNDYRTLEITGYLGEVILGYKRCRGELNYSLGDRKLLARLGGCYIYNNVKELEEVFKDQEKIIEKTLSIYQHDCLFKKFHQIYVDFRNRFICGSAHNIEHNNFRIPMLFSKNALKAKWMYFSNFSNNTIPDEKISIDLLSLINPMLALLPFASENDDVIPRKDNLLNPVTLKIEPDNTIHDSPKVKNESSSYISKVTRYMDNIEISEEMLLHILDYSESYYPVCLGLFCVLERFKNQPEDLKSSHGRETIRKIYDLYYEISTITEID